MSACYERESGAERQNLSIISASAAVEKEVVKRRLFEKDIWRKCRWERLAFLPEKFVLIRFMTQKGVDIRIRMWYIA